jgi:hypothetical protein
MSKTHACALVSGANIAAKLVKLRAREAKHAIDRSATDLSRAATTPKMFL